MLNEEVVTPHSDKERDRTNGGDDPQSNKEDYGRRRGSEQDSQGTSKGDHGRGNGKTEGRVRNGTPWCQWFTA